MKPSGVLGKARHALRAYFDRLAFAREYADLNAEHPRWMNLFKAPEFEINRVEIAVAGAGTEFSLRIGVIADIHCGSHPGDVERLRAAVAAMNALEPDLVVLPGDFMNMTPIGWGRVPPTRVAEILGGLVAPLGRFAILGNHDRDFGPQHVSSALEAVGIVVLENRECEISVGNRRLRIVGIEDARTGQPDIALMQTKTDADFTIILTHDPALYAYAQAGSSLMICGHTHGGQIVLPWIGPVVNASDAPLRWSSGHVSERGSHLFVSRGFGTSGLPIRLNCPPEIAILEVRCSE